MRREPSPLASGLTPPSERLGANPPPRLTPSPPKTTRTPLWTWPEMREILDRLPPWTPTAPLTSPPTGSRWGGGGWGEREEDEGERRRVSDLEDYP